jgi:hypothetical protein
VGGTTTGVVGASEGPVSDQPTTPPTSARLGGDLLEAGPDHLAEGGRDLLEHVVRQLGRRVLQVRDERLHHVLRCVGRTTRDHLEEQGAERVEVGARVDGASRELLRRHVARRPDEHPLARELLLALVLLGALRDLRDAEVDDLHVLTVRALDEHHVRRLEVSVHDAVPVRVAQRARDLPRDEGGSPDGQATALPLEELPERGPVDELHRHGAS